MGIVRQLIAQRHIALLVCAAALFLKLAVPAGYMIGSADDHMTITLCSGMAAQPMAMDMPGDRSDHERSARHDKAEMPCAFAGLSAVSLAAIDPVLLAGLIAFVTSVGVATRAPPLPNRRPHLRPPLRGPPPAL